MCLSTVGFPLEVDISNPISSGQNIMTNQILSLILYLQIFHPLYVIETQFQPTVNFVKQTMKSLVPDILPCIN